MAADFNILRRYFGVPTRIAAKSEKTKAFDKAMATERRRSLTGLNKARELAERHGINIERESARAYWVTCDAFDADDVEDPLDGNHFCSDGREVLDAVEAYVKALETAGSQS